MDRYSLPVESARLARVLSNVLAFCPARSKWPFVALEIDPFQIIAMSGDDYTVGRDWTELAEPASSDFSVSVILERADVLEIEKAARADKKGTGSLELSGPSPEGEWNVAFYGANRESSDDVVAVIGHKPAAERLAYINAALQLLERLEPESWLFTLPIAFTPDLLSRFAKVRRQDNEPTVADFWITSPEDAVLVKVGPSFMAAIQPVVRDVYAGNYGSESLHES